MKQPEPFLWSLSLQNLFFLFFLPVGVDVGDAGKQPEGASELGVDAVVEENELSVRRGEAQLPNRLELV